jgi:hypothetical protein
MTVSDQWPIGADVSTVKGTAWMLLRRLNGLLEEHGAQNKILLYYYRNRNLWPAAGPDRTMAKLAIEKK